MGIGTDFGYGLFPGHLLVLLADHQRRKRGPSGERSPVSWEFWNNHYAPELGEIAKKMKSVLDSDSSLLDRLCQEQGIFSGRLFATYCLFKMFRGSHYYTTPSSTHSSQQPASDTLADDFGQEMSTSSQPWAWKDALRGRETCRWGCDLVKAPPPDSANHQDYEQAKSALESWRWFGMVFWDRERVEQLNQSSELNSCKSGWLVPWQD